MLSHIRDIVDATGINIKSNFNLRNTTQYRGYSCEFKLAKHIILGHGTFTFLNLNEHSRLVVRVDHEGLCLFGRNGSIVLDKDSYDSISHFNAKGKRNDISNSKC